MNQKITFREISLVLMVSCNKLNPGKGKLIAFSEPQEKGSAQQFYLF